MDMRKTLKERFDEKYYVDTFTLPGCWVWTSGKNVDGRGQIHVGPGRNSHKLAHRVAYELYIGPIPEGLLVLHKCHNGHLGCVNPNHLYVGTQEKNIADAIEAGYYFYNLQNLFAHGRKVVKGTY
jgi:hypothetical protein